MAETYIEATLEDGRQIHRVNAPFDESLKVLRKERIKYPISILDLATQRMQVPKDHSLNQNGSYTCHGLLHAKGSPVLLARVGPLAKSIKLASAAVQANKEGRYFSTDSQELYKKYAGIAEKDKNKEPIKRRVLVLPSRNSFQTSPTENSEILDGLLDEKGRDYLEFCNLSNLAVYPVDSQVVDFQSGTLLTQAWLRRVVSDSDVDGSDRNLDFDDGVRGVSSAGEASAPKISTARSKKPYTPKQLERTAQITEQVMGGNRKSSDLEKVLSFLNQLKN